MGNIFYYKEDGETHLTILSSAGGEFPAKTTENSIELVRKALGDYGGIRRIREVITDNGKARGHAR